MSGKGLPNPFRCNSCASRSLKGIQRRAFTSYPAQQRHGAVPAFNSPSNPELEELLTNVRNKIFVPSHLSRSHRDLVFKDKRRKLFDTEPVHAILSDERFQLEHIDQLKDVPNKRATLRSFVELMKEKKDWENLPSLLTGLYESGRTFSAGDKAWLVRKAGMASRLDVILECARRVRSTGFALNNLEIVSELMFQIHEKALNSHWDPTETRQALGWVEMVSELLEDERHSSGGVRNTHDDLRIQPEVVGILLQLSTVWALRFSDGQDLDGKVAKYAARLLGTPKDILITRTYQATEVRQTEYFASRVRTLMYPLLHGAKLADGMLGTECGLADWLHGFRQVIPGFDAAIGDHEQHVTSKREEKISTLLANDIRASEDIKTDTVP